MGVRRFSCIETLKVHHMVGAFGHSKIFEVYPYIYISVPFSISILASIPWIWICHKIVTSNTESKSTNMSLNGSYFSVNLYLLEVLENHRSSIFGICICNLGCPPFQ